MEVRDFVEVEQVRAQYHSSHSLWKTFPNYSILTDGNNSKWCADEHFE